MSSTFRRRVAVSATALLFAAGLTACSGSTEPSASGTNIDDGSGPIKIGAVDALTGAYAVLGAQILDGVTAAIESVNESGGVLGRQIELTSLDNQSNATIAQQQITQLRSQHEVVAILGPEDSTSIAAAVPVSSRLAVPTLVSSAAWPNGLDAAQTSWAWSGTVNTQDGIDRYIEYFAENDIKRVAIIGNGTPFSQQLKDYLDSRDDLSFEVVADEQFTTGKSDVSPQLLRAIDADPDFVLSWISGTDQVNTVKTYKRLGTSIPLGINGGNAGSAVREAVGDENFEGVFALAYPTMVLDELTPDWPSRQAAERYLADMEAAGLDADGGASNAVLGWDAAMSMIDAIESAGSTDPDAIQDALNSQEYTGATTVWKRSEEDHSGSAPGGYVLVQSSGDTWGLVLAAS